MIHNKIPIYYHKISRNFIEYSPIFLWNFQTENSPVMREGYLMKKNARHRYKRRWVSITTETVQIYKDRDHLEPKVNLPLLTCSVKIPPPRRGADGGQKEYKYSFHLITADETFKFFCDTQAEVGLKFPGNSQNVFSYKIITKFWLNEKLRIYMKFSTNRKYWFYIFWTNMIVDTVVVAIIDDWF